MKNRIAMPGRQFAPAWFAVEQMMEQRSREVPLHLRKAPSGGAAARLCICFALAVCVTCFTTASLAQKQAQTADSPLMKQLHQALSVAEHGDARAALAMADRLLEAHPDFVPALKLQGMLLEEAGQSVEAAQSYQKGLKLAPNDADLLFKVGVVRLVSGNKDEAVALFQHHLRLQPKDGDALFYLAQAYHLTGHDEMALKTIQECLKLQANNPPVWQKYGELLCGTGDCEGGLQWLLKAQHADASLERIDYDIAAADYKLMDLAGAAQYSARAVQSHSNDVKALQLLAAADVKLGNWQEARSGFARVLAFKSDDVEALLGLGQCDLELKDYPAAVTTLQLVLRLDPTRFLAHFYLSRAFAGIGRTAEAQHEAALHQLMMEQMTFVRSLENDEREGAIKAQAHQLLAAHREGEALRLYQEHFKGTSATPADSFVFAGKLELFMGNTEDGLRLLHHALEMQPTVRGAHTYEGILALKLGDLNRAEKEFGAELANDPSYQMAIAEMGELRYRQERWSDAAEQLARSRTMTPELLYMLCDSYFHIGKISDADLNAEALAAYAKNRPEVMQDLVALLVRNGQAELAKQLSANSAP